jgi:FemAB-related protein (PEP-CTERM system-associated)
MTTGAPRVAPFTGDGAEWDSFVRAQTGWTHFHLHGWRRVMERAFGHRCLYLAARGDDGALRGVLPLVRVKSPLFGHFLVSMPFLNYGGPLGDADAVRALVAAASAEAQRSRAKLLELRSPTEQPIDLPVSHRKITVRLDLADTPDAQFKRFDAKLRSQIRKPQKDGVTVRLGLDQVPQFYEVFAHHMRDLGTPVLSRRFFEEIVATFPDSTLLAVAYLEEKPVATGLGFRWGDEFEITWASSLLSAKKSAPNMLVYWELLQACVRDGVRRFDFGRCTPGGGTHKFKQQWGGADAPMYWYQRSESPDAKTPSPDDGAYSWGPRVWKKLPIAVANAVGPRVVKYIP